MRSSALVVVAVMIALTTLWTAAAGRPETPHSTGAPGTPDEQPIDPPAEPEPFPFWIELELLADGLNQPVYVTDADDGSDRLYVVEKRGVVRIVEDGQVLATPFLDLSSKVRSTGVEQGMLGLAFHPDYEENGYLYVTYSPSIIEWRLERYTVSDDRDRVDAGTAATILSVEHPGTTHYGGMATFGPDGYLWVSIGDGGAGAYDPLGHSQDLTSLLGKLLRLDVNGGFPYAIPPDNPFAGQPERRPEIWAYGLRNPWRFSFDRLTGDLFIGDVGESSWEEINIESAESAGGRNYGWPLVEGLECTPVAPECDPDQFVAPILVYDRVQGCSVTGGYVYREDPASPVYGAYLYSDYCEGTLWMSRPDITGVWDTHAELETSFNVSSFGEDSRGRLYLTDLGGGGVYRLRMTGAPLKPTLNRADPNVILTDGAACALNLRGWNFLPTAQAFVDGEPRATAFRDSSWLTVELTAGDLATPDTLILTVANDDNRELLSGPASLEIRESGLTSPALHRSWARADLPVRSGVAQRTWIWGPAGVTCPQLELYVDSPGRTRIVQYFDKSRMEINDPGEDPDDPWYVTNGLLVVELVTGRRQIGDAAFQLLAPSRANVAGDLDNRTGPSYATFGELLEPVSDRTGQLVAHRLERDGTVWLDPSTNIEAVRVARFDPVTGHNIPAPFWEFMNSNGVVYESGSYVEANLFPDPVFSTGRPITEPYWTDVAVGGEITLVMVQCFERRCLTYTPSNHEDWQVESGNVGMHYYRWVQQTR